MKKYFVLLVSLLFILPSCQKESIDFRNDVIGNYIGTIEKVSWTATAVNTAQKDGTIQHKHILSDTTLLLQKDKIVVSKIGLNTITLNFPGQLGTYLQDYQNEFEWYAGNSYHETYTYKNNQHREGYLTTIHPEKNQLIFNFKVETTNPITKESKRVYLTFKGEKQTIAAM